MTESVSVCQCVCQCVCVIGCLCVSASWGCQKVYELRSPRGSTFNLSINVPVREPVHVQYWAAAWSDRVGLLGLALALRGRADA